MSISVDQSLLERVLAILRESDDYRDLKRDLDEYFPEDSWADTADSSGPFALAFTQNAESEGGWLPQGELSTFWDAVEHADPEQASSSDDLYRLLREMIAGWQNAASEEATDEPAEFQSVTAMPGDNYVGWKQGVTIRSSRCGNTAIRSTDCGGRVTRRFPRSPREAASSPSATISSCPTDRPTS